MLVLQFKGKTAIEKKKRRKKGRVGIIFDSLLELSLLEKSMTLREATRNILSLVGNISGCPVVVSEDALLKTLAASRIARGRDRARYRDSAIYRTGLAP